MRLTHLLFVGTAFTSASAIAAGDPAPGQQSQAPQSQSEPHAQQQSRQSGASANEQLVKQAQEKLGAAGYDAGSADGKMGAKTKQALMEFQREEGLQPSGRLDPDTLAALDVDAGGSAATGSSSPSDR